MTGNKNDDDYEKRLRSTFFIYNFMRFLTIAGNQVDTGEPDLVMPEMPELIKEYFESLADRDDFD